MRKELRLSGQIYIPKHTSTYLFSARRELEMEEEQEIIRILMKQSREAMERRRSR